MGDLNVFLEEFYSAISFVKVEDFSDERFANLFLRNASLVERSGDVVKSETIAEYIERFHYEAEHYPELFSRGFAERQLEYEALDGDDFIFVKSKYEKTFFNGKEMVVAGGYNYMTICANGDVFKIMSVAWAG